MAADQLAPGAARRARACGRDAFRVEAARRDGRDGHRVPAQFRAGHAEVLVDAELGILLRVAWLADGAEPEVTELVSLDLDPVIDPALFSPPPGSLVAESMGDALRAGRPSWTVLKTVAGWPGRPGCLDEVRAVRLAAGGGAGRGAGRWAG